MAGTIGWDELLAAADRTGPPMVPLDPVQQSDLCALPYSSGTTGVSKGVMLSHRNLVSNLCSSMFAVGPELLGQVVTLGLMPFFHIYGITRHLLRDAAAQGHGGGDGPVRPAHVPLARWSRTRVMFAPVVPPVMLAMVKNPIADEFELSGLALNCITLTHAGDDPEKGHIAKKNSVGFILPNLEVKFVDPDTGRSLPKNTPGELCVRSQCVMQGYYRKKEETERTIDAKGWLHTGDVGYIDDDGDVFIVDRIKELIKYKGFQVAPCRAGGHTTCPILRSKMQPSSDWPDEEAGEVPASCVVRRRGAEESEADIMAYVASRVASYKRLRTLHLVDAIPKSVSGKILRRQLRDEFINMTKRSSLITIGIGMSRVRRSFLPSIHAQEQHV
ncbi:hypothetical protein ACQ4PT_071591 [Festuca glaucescens]